MPAEYYIGLMSGTSLDGIDAVLTRFDTSTPAIATHFEPFPDPLRAELRDLLHPGSDEINRSAEAANELSRRYAEAVHVLLSRTSMASRDVRAIGCHGQTVRHNPERGFTIQLCNGALLAELTGITVVCDFRSRDIAAHGQGAPLVPAFHAAAFAHPDRPRAVVNLGGIANVTHLAPKGPVTGFDCGPGNALLDEWIAEQRGLAYDSDGAWAAQGTVLPTLLEALLADPYFAKVPPKSTGREAFNLKWAHAHLYANYRPADVQATFAELTARCVADALHSFCPGVEQVFLCGGGANNADLVARIARLVPGTEVGSTAALGIAPDWVEALAFSWLARETLESRPGNLPSVTGATGLRILGCVYPA
ncbi:MAG: anhydro-N-acetylmuramic acid kinase [Betaproteobacteria bacterium]|nr:MAG: anhydro-N-acetylmuramic acid kinase [Betaproteobacteria bacterium]